MLSLKKPGVQSSCMQLKSRMKRFSLFLLVPSLVYLATCMSCKTRAICGMFQPRHEITFINDSMFKYSKWYGDSDTNSFYFYSEGTYAKTGKNTYILNSIKFNPDSIELICSLKDDPKINGLRLKILTEMFSNDFKFYHCSYIVYLDNQEYGFSSSTVDTILPLLKPKQVNITLTLPPDSVIPNCRYFAFKSLPIQTSDSKFNSINIWFPDVSKYFNWYSIDNVLLRSSGKGKERIFQIGDDKWPVTLIKK
jgi:hypothetical protein